MKKMENIELLGDNGFGCFDDSQEQKDEDYDDDNLTQSSIKNIFEEIEKTKSPSEIKKYRNKIESENNIFFNETKYPKIEFCITRKEIEYLKNEEYSKFLNDPLAKLLYAMAWKQGDLPKLKHIIDGILISEEEDISHKNALVFYQFGKHLAAPETEPIVDVNIFYAFNAYKNPVSDKFPNMNNRKYQKELILQYKKWLKEITKDIENKKEYLYEVDKLLFILGKTIKSKSRLMRKVF